MGKKVSIVFESDDEKPPGEGGTFKVYVEGAEGTKVKAEAKWSAIEYWGMKCFAIVRQVMQESGAFSHATTKPERDKRD